MKKSGLNLFMFLILIAIGFFIYSSNAFADSKDQPMKENSVIIGILTNFALDMSNKDEETKQKATNGTVKNTTKEDTIDLGTEIWGGYFIVDGFEAGLDFGFGLANTNQTTKGNGNITLTEKNTTTTFDLKFGPQAGYYFDTSSEVYPYIRLEFEGLFKIGNWEDRYGDDKDNGDITGIGYSVRPNVGAAIIVAKNAALDAGFFFQYQSTNDKRTFKKKTFGSGDLNTTRTTMDYGLLVGVDIVF